MKNDTPDEESILGSTKIVRSRVLRFLLWFVGMVSVVLGVLGIFLPILPTTPFLLLAAACYIRSSETFYDWLVSHPRLSQYILAYLDGSGLPRKAKIYTLSTLWLTMSFSLYLVPLWPVRGLMILIGCSVSFYIWRLAEPAVVE